MDTSIIGLIVIAVVGVVLLVAAMTWMLLTKPQQDRRDPDTIGEDAGGEALTVRKQEALAGRIFADGRRAARADVDDAAHVIRLHQHLDGHRTETPTARRDLDVYRDIADVVSDRPDPRHTEI
jgi:hypothetical protein